MNKTNLIINNFKEPIKHRVKKADPPPRKDFWDKFQSILNIILN
jgi:hypothetical protein